MEPYAKPSDVSADQGEVIVDGPDGVAVSLTPEAAMETSKRLREQSDIAQAQTDEADGHDSRSTSEAA